MAFSWALNARGRAVSTPADGFHPTIVVAVSSPNTVRCRIGDDHVPSPFSLLALAIAATPRRRGAAAPPASSSDRSRSSLNNVRRREWRLKYNNNTQLPFLKRQNLRCRSPASPEPHTLGNGDSYPASVLASTLVPSSDGPPALVAPSPCRVSPALFGRDAVKARDALLGQCPLGQPRGVRRRGYSPGHRPRDAHSVETTPDV